jgi:uncharacterized lipoprotein YajG
MKTQMISRLFLMLVTLSLFVSCSEDQTTAPSANNAPLAKFSDIKAKVFTNCLGAQCHSSAGNQGNLVLESNVG